MFLLGDFTATSLAEIVTLWWSIYNSLTGKKKKEKLEIKKNKAKFSINLLCFVMETPDIVKEDERNIKHSETLLMLQIIYFYKNYMSIE